MGRAPPGRYLGNFTEVGGLLGLGDERQDCFPGWNRHIFGMRPTSHSGAPMNTLETPLTIRASTKSEHDEGTKPPPGNSRRQSAGRAIALRWPRPRRAGGRDGQDVDESSGCATSPDCAAATRRGRRSAQSPTCGDLGSRPSGCARMRPARSVPH